MIGNTMNTHSCSKPQLGAKIAVAKLRAGFTDVLSIGIADEVHDREHQPDRDRREARVRRTCA